MKLEETLGTSNGTDYSLHYLLQMNELQGSNA